jgi:hypothetical protein
MDKENYIEDHVLEEVFNELSTFHDEYIVANFGNEPEHLEKDILFDFDPIEYLYEDEVIPFSFIEQLPIRLCAIDVGATRIGESSDGAIVAYRGCIITQYKNDIECYLYRTGPVFLSNKYKAQILHRIGKELGNETIFVETDENGKPINVKPGVADNTNQYSDRIRNFIERKLQEKACKLIKNGIILFDGALTKNTRDTPTEYVENNILQPAFENGNSILAISKKSSVTINNKPISFALEDHPNKICFRSVQALVNETSSGSQRNFGQMYVARFSEYGQTFRVDLCAPLGARNVDILNIFWSNSNFRNGYPELLVRAHIHTYIPFSAIIAMRAKAIVEHNIKVKNELGFGGVFAPFGGGFK